MELATERRSPNNASLRDVVLAGLCMEFAIGRLAEAGPGYALTAKDCEHLAELQSSWQAKLDNLRRKQGIVRLPLVADQRW